MIADRSKERATSNPSRELQKLRRQDLLELLLEQMRENDSLRAAVDSDQAQIAHLTSLTRNLKAQLNDKDALLKALYENIRSLTEATKRSEREHAALQLDDLFMRHFLNQTAREADE